MNDITFKTINFEDFNNTDTGNAKILSQLHGNEIRWCDAMGWLFYNNKYWEKVGDVKIEQLARDVPKYLCSYASTIDDASKRQTIAAQALKAESSSAIKAMVSLLKSEPDISISHDKFDADPWKLNVQNGTIDLKTGRKEPHNKNDYITHITEAAFDTGASAEHWRKYLYDVMCGDTKLVDYLQRYMGYTLTGLTREQSFLFFSGTGANGKSVFTETIAKMMGSYGKSLAPDALIVKYGNSATNELAALAGLRYVYSAEIDASKTLDAGLLKLITGGDATTCRFLFREYFILHPQFKLVYSANGEPKVKDDSYGFWRRCKKIPFNACFKIGGEHEPDPELQEKLNKEINGILMWALEGLAKYRQSGPEEPSSVSHATSEYQTNMSSVRQFIDDRTSSDVACVVSLKNLHTAYSLWCDANDERPISSKALVKKLEEYGYITYKGVLGKMIKGITLTPKDESENDGMTEKVCF